jgi:hypothetical protein
MEAKATCRRHKMTVKKPVLDSVSTIAKNKKVTPAFQHCFLLNSFVVISYIHMQHFLDFSLRIEPTLKKSSNRVFDSMHDV